MQVNNDQTTSLNREIIEDHQEVIALYLKYWEEHILPIKEENRKGAFLHILLDVAERQYGMEVFSEICMRVFRSGK